MTKKNLTKESKTFIGEVVEIIQATEADKSEIDDEISLGNKKLMAFLDGAMPWAGLYSLSHEMIIALFLELLGAREKISELVEAEDKQQAKMAFFRDLVTKAEDEEFYDELDELEPEEQGLFMAILFAVMGNLEGLEVLGSK